MKNTPKNATLRSFYAEPSSEYSVIPMPEGIGNISGEKASQGFGKNWSWMVSIPAKDPSNPTSEARECSMMVGADDLAKLEIAGQVLELTSRGPQGGGPYEEKHSSFSLAPGIYEASLSYSNIDYDPPEKNVAILAFGLSVEEESIPEEQVVPTDDVPTSTKNPCPCDECSTENAGGYPGVEEFATVQGKSRSRLLPLQSSSSSAGSQVVNTADHNNMFWSSNFGIFRGMAGIPSGFLEIVVHQMSPEAYHVSSLKFNHPLAGRLNLPSAIQEKRHAGESPFANALVPLSVGGQVNYAFIQGNAWGVGPVGSSLGKDAGFQLFGKDFAPASSSNPAEYLATLALDRSASFYSLITGELAYFVSPSKVKYSREDLEQFLHVSYDEFGSIQQIWNLWDGLVNIENVDNSSYCIALYLPSQVGTQDPDSGLYGVEGDAFKRFTIAEDLSCQGFSITEQVAGRQAFTNRWWRANDAWCMSQGEGEEAIMKLRERNTLSEDEWELITRIKKGNAGEVISSTYEKFKTTPVGNLCLSRIKGYESSCAQTSGYTYDSAGRIAKEILPDGGRREYTYDKFGRIKESFEP